ncbi:pyridoxal phosphate-dependent aminotransferase [Pararhizobium haloflavum]|uniref:pyridoxal phosphate-dependent aminotransferase n=1 Tax=Pararhizobium haloflavum TaxID=2037914 RepID=UPI000C18153D|nr:pyridoxal phosphate-dependent aminotransferase [Pararhizobium haloflavum]
MSLIDHLNPLARQAPESGIVEVVNHGRGRPDLIPLWVGEGDLATPEFIARGVVESLAKGETFYTWQRGIPELRRALADYHARHFGRTFQPENFFVTGSGMQSIRIAIEAVAGPGSEIVYFSPAWPNFKAALEISGSEPVPVVLDHGEEGWSLDLSRVEDAITARTRAIFVNTPANPTGFTAGADQLADILSLARRHGLWIIADEIYARFFYEGARAPSFFDVAAAEDRILFVNSFSKNWSMTGWRIGWIHAPRELGQVLENLIQYSTSGVAHFMQQGAVLALDEGEAFLASQIDRASRARDLLCDALIATERVRLAKPQGAFYAFFAIEGMADTRQAALDLVDGAGVGLAPGTAFGRGGEKFLRACFHRRLDQVEQAADRLVTFINGL